MKIQFFLLLLLLLRLRQVVTFTPAARRDQQCSYLTDKIYCYGGAAAESTYPSEVLSLPVHNNGFINVGVLRDSWTEIRPDPNYGSEGRALAQVIASTDRTKMYIQGGAIERGLLQHSFIVFDANTETWSTLPDYEQYGLGNRPIRYGTVLYAPYINKLVFFGGMMKSPLNITVNVDGLDITPIFGNLYFGFHNITTFDMVTQQWQQINNASSPNSTHFYSHLESVYDPNSNSSIYIGGLVTLRANLDIWSEKLFNTISIFDFNNYVWSEEECTGSIPNLGTGFTATLLPDNETILVYGKTIEDDILGGSCFLLDIKPKVWSPCRIYNADNYDTRYGHSAVLVGNHLFILFGEDNYGNLKNDMLILDVSNKYDISFVFEYTYNDSLSEATKGLGIAAIVGIVISCVVLIAGVTGIIFIRQRNQQKKAELSYNFPKGWDDEHEYRSLHTENTSFTFKGKKKQTSNLSTVFTPDFKSPYLSLDFAHEHKNDTELEQTNSVKPEQRNPIKPEQNNSVKSDQNNSVKSEQCTLVTLGQDNTIKPEQSNTVKPEQYPLSKPEEFHPSIY